MLVGLTGPSGAGKGTAVAAFEKNGFCVIDADKVARDVVMPGEAALTDLSSEFGADIINSDGTLNRRLLAQRAFASRESADRLNNIMLSVICARMLKQAADMKEKGINCVFDAPLLFEGGLDGYCDCCIAVTAPLELRISRLAARDGLTYEEISKRIKVQHEDEYYTHHCEYVIVNDGSLAELEEISEKTVKEIIKKYSTKE